MKSTKSRKAPPVPVEQRPPRLYLKKSETDKAELGRRLRLGGDVKDFEMANLFRSLSDESEFTGTDGNWMTVLPQSPSKKDFGGFSILMKNIHSCSYLHE